jgi:hypothetical protein
VPRAHQCATKRRTRRKRGRQRCRSSPRSSSRGSRPTCRTGASVSTRGFWLPWLELEGVPVGDGLLTLSLRRGEPPVAHHPTLEVVQRERIGDHVAMG